MKVIHWTKDRDFQLKPIRIRNGYESDGLPDKPLGGLWCSPLHSKYDWKDWCKAESFRDISQCVEVLLDIREEGMLVINSEADLQKLPTTTAFGCIKCVNFRELLHMGYRSIWLTRTGLWKTRLTYPISLYSWDCETVLIMDASIVNHYKVKEASNDRVSR